MIEYKLVDFSTDYTFVPTTDEEAKSFLLKILNDLGKDGWIIAVSAPEEGRAIFYREKKEYEGGFLS